MFPKHKKNLSFRRLAATFVMGTALLFGANQAQAQAVGATTISIDFPNIVILHYVSAATITFESGTLVDTGVDESALAADSADLAATATFDLGVTGLGGAPPALPGSVAVTLEDAWAVRGISDTGDMTVDIVLTTAVANDSATTNDGSEAVASNIMITDGTSTDPSQITISAPGFTTPTIGNVTFDLDISSVTSAAVHSGIVYTITATGI